ncbi:MAG: type II toxin-antitoxin system RelE/ParE family toxin [Bacteroidetes bacterium]|nr:type II toxin-antitoxin system RelE/ParE family toxin [Bacteroidota bacterium]
MAKYFLSNKAVEDLSDIWNYTYDEWSETQADKYYQELIDCCKNISKNPAIGRQYPEIDFGILGYLANKHIIFYRLLKANEIEVIRILHSSMDLKNRIKE